MIMSEDDNKWKELLYRKMKDDDINRKKYNILIAKDFNLEEWEKL